MSDLEVRVPFNNNTIIEPLQNKSESVNLSLSENDKALYFGPNWRSYFQHDVNPVNKLDINPIAEFTLEVDFEYLTNSIKTNGQYNPILLWLNPKTRRKEIVDGRHRMWACNVLGIKVKTETITATREELPATILDIQLTQTKVPNKNTSAGILVRYLSVYGNRTTITAQSLVAKYPNTQLTKKDMAAMKYLLDKEPRWFAILEAGNSVDPDNGTYTKISSARALQKLSKEKYATITTRDVIHGEATNPQLAKLFKDVEALISTVTIESPEQGSQLAYVLKLQYQKIQSQYPQLEVASEEEYYDGERYGELL